MLAWSKALHVKFKCSDPRAQSELSLRFQMAPASEYYEGILYPVPTCRGSIWSAIESPGATFGVEEHRGGERKTKCLKFWKSSEGFTRQNQRRIRGSPEGLPARYLSRSAHGRSDLGPG